MPKFERKVVVAGAIETVHGTDPGSGYAAVLVNEGASINSEAQTTDRNTVKDSFSPQGSVIGQKTWKMNMDVEMKGGGTNAGSLVVPETDWLMKCCGMQREDGFYIPVSVVTGTFLPGEMVNDGTTTDLGTLVAVEDQDGDGTKEVMFLRNGQGNPISGTLTGAVSGATATPGTAKEAFVYRPVTDWSKQDSATVRFGLDGLRHLSTYTKGSLSLNVDVGGYGVFTFDLSGVFNLPTDTPNPSASYSTLIPPVAVNAGLAIGNWDMTTTAATNLKFDLANTLAQRNDFGATDGVIGVDITGRATNGSINPEATTLAGYNVWEKWKSAAQETIFATFGADGGDGERVHLLAPKSQYQSISYAGREGVVAYDLPFNCIGGNEAAGGVGGDDEFYIIFY